MHLDTQFKLQKDTNYKNFLRENAYWYKILNRDPTRFNEFTKEMKEKYRLRAVDKLTDLADNISLLSMLFGGLK